MRGLTYAWENDPHLMEQLYAALAHWVYAYGLHGAFVLMVAESMGAPLPTEVGFLAGQGLISSGSASYWTVFAWLAAGQLVGSGLAFYLGRATDSAFARRLARRPRVMEARAKLQGWFARHAALTIVFGRLVGQVRPWASFIAGLSQVPQTTFWFWTAAGTMTFTACTMWITDVGWKFWMANPQWRLPLIVGMIVLFYGLPAYKLIEHVIKRHRRHQQHLTSE